MEMGRLIWGWKWGDVGKLCGIASGRSMEHSDGGETTRGGHCFKVKDGDDMLVHFAVSALLQGEFVISNVGTVRSKMGLCLKTDVGDWNEAVQLE